MANAMKNARNSSRSTVGRQYQLSGGQRIEDSGIAERVSPGRVAMQEIQRKDGDEHQHSADHRVQHEFHCRIDPAISAPDSDEEVHRNQHDFPEHVEQKQVQRAENTDHPGLQQQHEDEVFLRAFSNGPRRQHGQRRENRRQQNQEQADAIHTHVITDAERRYPWRVDDVLEIGRAGVEMRDQMKRKHE